MTDLATKRQIAAADPRRSTWVSANAGSGKTRVLTNRVARLLLAGCEPQKILCLTYTKAAAAEMQNRLFATLGSWAMKPDGALAEELAKLGETEVSVDALAAARKLFARALETPGGLKIQTIHSFAGAVLRRFPLEAGVSPQFQEMDERQANQLRAEVLEQIAEDVPDVFTAMALELSGEDTGKLLDGILKYADAMGTWDAQKMAGLLDANPDASDDQLLSRAFQGVSDADLYRLAEAMAAGGKNDQVFCRKIKDGLRLTAADAFNAYENAFLTNGQRRSDHNFPTKAVKDAHTWVPEMMELLKDRLFEARQERLKRDLYHRTKALYDFATAFTDRYADRKAALGRLDFDDLIQKTRALLSEPGLAAWVLYRLDGGIDHILVDEAQDTSPEQWEIVRLLAEEFFVGEGATEGPRTIFVVGDEKQSIYSFQGADPQEFGKMRDHFAGKLTNIAQELQTKALLHSFRSASPVLDLVDRVFDGEVPLGITDPVEHVAHKTQLPGRVELWPFVLPSEKSDPGPWWEPLDMISENAPVLILAEALARRVATIIASGQKLPGKDRAIRAGDFMVLVQRRGPLFHAIIKALKNAGVEVAGADRLKIVEELAVKDLLALLTFLATPRDDLSLAAVLRSPLCGLSEDDLFRLAHGRDGSLWRAVGESGHARVVAMLNSLLGDADFIRPYDLLEKILITHDGRRKLLARLGAEAEDGIDELLNQALAYESVEAPTLTGFLSWISSDDVEVKRQMDAAGDRVRVMTVHGAKGLESPIVILPDTAKKDEWRNPPEVVLKDDIPIWRTSGSDAPEMMAAMEEDRKALVRKEDGRLLYVAMTRAENWLIVAGAGTERYRNGGWYSKIEAGFDGAETEPAPDGLAGEVRVISRNWSDAEGAVDTVTTKHVELPEPLARPAPVLSRKPQMLSPSDLGGEHSVLGGDPAAAEDAMARGTAIHLLLEHLPGAPDRAATAAHLTDDWQDLLPEVEAVLDNPALAWIFAPETLAEVAITAHIDPLGAPILGRIDRLVVADDHVLAVDFKSNRDVPDSPETTPSGFLKQMGAYADALRQVYPDKEIRTAILWTRTATLMELPENVTAAALRLDGPEVAT